MMINLKQLHRLSLELDEYVSNVEYRNILVEEIANNYGRYGIVATQLYVKRHMAEAHPYFRTSCVERILKEAEVARRTDMIENNIFWDHDGGYILGGDHA